MALRRNIMKPNSSVIEGFIVYEMKLEDFEIALNDENFFKPILNNVFLPANNEKLGLMDKNIGQKIFAETDSLENIENVKDLYYEEMMIFQRDTKERSINIKPELIFSTEIKNKKRDKPDTFQSYNVTTGKNITV